MADITPNTNGSFTLYDVDGVTVTLTFRGANPPPAGFKVVTKPVGDAPAGYTWLLNFGVQNRGGQFLPSVSYSLQGSARPDQKPWVIYYGGQVRGMNGDHTSPGDPPIGHG